MTRAVIDLEAARAMHAVINEMHAEDGDLGAIVAFEDVPAEWKARYLRMMGPVGDVYLRGVR
jgi:hypothetical protein